MKNLLLYFKISVFINCILFSFAGFGQSPQSTPPDTSQKAKALIPANLKKPVYPKIVGYLSVLIPFVTVNNVTSTANFSHGATTLGFPVGINVFYGPRFGFSYEFTPFIKAGSGTSKSSNLLFDPGTIFRFDGGNNLITRLAFETSGRYGFTPAYNRTYLRTKDVNYFFTIGLPARFGNNATATVTLTLQLGLTFN